MSENVDQRLVTRGVLLDIPRLKGVPYLEPGTHVYREDVEAWDPVIRAIEIQAPHWRPSDGHAYHAITIGWLVGEVIRRITGLSAGTYFRRALGDPLGLRTWIGLPAAEHASVAWMISDPASLGGR